MMYYNGVVAIIADLKRVRKPENSWRRFENCYSSRINQCLWQSPEVDGFHEAIPVWERAYAVTKTKRCIEGAAGTRGADKVIAEDALLRTYWVHSYRPS